MVENRKHTVSQVDFHVHYTDETARDIVDEARRKQILAIALINRVAFSKRIREHVEYGEREGVEVIPGLEVVRYVNGQDVELIALGLDLNSGKFKTHFEKNEVEERNKKVALKQREYFKRQGFEFSGLLEEDEKDVVDILDGRIGAKAIGFCKAIARSTDPGNRTRLDEIKISNSELWENVQNVFSSKPAYSGNVDLLTAKFLYELHFGPGKPGRLLARDSAEDLIKTIHECGGVVIYSPEGNFDQGVWNELVNIGIDGVMAWHGSRLGEDRKHYCRIRNNFTFSIN